ncbi:winged helix-turn-helix transcriptional regulator [Sporomusa malonica]|uniref:Transcriptional regulator, HxlR family n=1 Tax=Sporomusa malonica TaxID=112901 RepID=A0A1W2CSY9_9FIRM|nr:helix-turn-helix domain-containing protein [Sporomusa malonica]SMC88331.1 transcriptional regulator, HxlR family [Sporomusa malonica]
MKIREEYTCPLELAHDITRGKWKPIILWQLRLGNTSLTNLERNIQSINQKMLIEQLKELMEFGMIDKRVFEGYPLKVEYFLTDRGKRMIEAITILQHIGIELMQENGMEEALREKGFIE